MKELKPPTLVLVGSEDEPDLLAIADILAKRVPAASRVILPSAKHHLNLDQPQEFDQLLRTFLTRLKWARPQRTHRTDE